MRQRDETVLHPRQHWLRVLDRGGASGAVARVADCGDAVNELELVRHRRGHRAHRSNSTGKALFVDKHDASRLLAAVLERIESELSEPDRLGVTANAKDAAHDLDWTLRGRAHDGGGRFGHDVGDRLVV